MSTLKTFKWGRNGGGEKREKSSVVGDVLSIDGWQSSASFPLPSSSSSSATLTASAAAAGGGAISAVRQEKERKGACF
jgi:hypothetical protein